jgi:3-keto-disaccharide hydrolase
MKTFRDTIRRSCILTVLAALALWLPSSTLAGAGNSADNTLSNAEHEAGWQLLFDGRNLDQWRTYGKPVAGSQWQIQDGAIVLTEGGGGDLITRGSFADFELQLQWKIAEGGNSGIFFHADESELPIYVHAAEIQILDDARHPDNKKADRRSGSLYDLIAAPAASQKPAGSWNTVVISHNNGHLQAWQNNVQTVDIDLRSKAFLDLVADSKFADWPGFAENVEGHIGLQDHGDVVSFRNLKIRALGEAQ